MSIPSLLLYFVSYYSSLWSLCSFWSPGSWPSSQASPCLREFARIVPTIWHALPQGPVVFSFSVFTSLLKCYFWVKSSLTMLFKIANHTSFCIPLSPIFVLIYYIIYQEKKKSLSLFLFLPRAQKLCEEEIMLCICCCIPQPRSVSLE